MTRAERQAQAQDIPFWWHSIELGEGAVSPGHLPLEREREQLEALRLPDLGGRSVLDVGAWDGFYSFAAEELGAARVVALDHWAWGLDVAAGEDFIPDPPIDLHRLPGKRGFDLAHRLRDSRVEAVVGDLATMDVAALGRFDVVLFLGVLYHLTNPLGALRRLRAVTGELAVIETHAIRIPGFEERPLWQLYPDDELGGDATNWWGPNARGLVDACRAAGFGQVEPVGTHHREIDFGDGVTRYRIVVHARP